MMVVGGGHSRNAPLPSPVPGVPLLEGGEGREEGAALLGSRSFCPTMWWPWDW